MAAVARVGTRGSSLARAQTEWVVERLRALAPDRDWQPGVVPTRVGKVHAGELDAVMLAAAGLGRLGIDADWLFDPEVVLPAPGQGALAIETREGAFDTGLLAALDDPDTRAAVVAERAVLRELGGGCMLPVATYGRLRAGTLLVEGSVTSPDGAKQAWA